jgi:hypothetical protein
MLVNTVIKNRWCKFSIVGAVTCLTVIFITLCFPVMVFPLTIDLSSHVVHVDDTISCTVTMVNNSYNDVKVGSNTLTPWVRLEHIKDAKLSYAEPLPYYGQVLKSGDKISTDIAVKVTEPGIYILNAHYNFEVNNQYHVFNNLNTIVIVLK